MKPLSRVEFTAALKKGHGRALQHVIHFGIEEYKDLVLDACIHNKNYDPQIDPSRAPWLFSMFHETQFYEEFRGAILNNIDPSESRDFFQMGSLLREMATAGDSLAKEKLKELAFENAETGSEDEDIIEKYIGFQSVDEFLELARILGNRLLKDPEDTPFDWLIPQEKKQEFKEILAQHAQTDPSIRKYWEYLEQKEQARNTSSRDDLDAEKRERHERLRQKYPLEKIIEDARALKGSYPGYYVTFGRHATPEELETVYATLLTEVDPPVQMRLLWVFRRAQLPSLDDRLLQWAVGPDEGLRAAVIAPLAQIQDARVHKLAKEKIKRRELLGPDQETIELFHKNYAKEDAALIAMALNSIEASEDDDAHELGYDLIELSNQVADPGLSNALKWVYEYTPCTFCRCKALKQLKGFISIDEQIKQEIPFDANDDIRGLVGT